MPWFYWLFAFAFLVSFALWLFGIGHESFWFWTGFVVGTSPHLYRTFKRLVLTIRHDLEKI